MAAAREQIWTALDAIDAAHEVLRGTSTDLVGNNFRVDIADRLETQERVNRGPMYRIFGEPADPPDGAGGCGSRRGRSPAGVAWPPASGRGVRDLIALAAESIHYLAVFDDHTKPPLYLGRQKRVATADQRLICYPRDRGCTHPNVPSTRLSLRSPPRPTLDPAAAPTPPPAHTNHAHHPEELLRGDPDPPE